MTTLTVGSGQEYTTIASAVAASSSGDTIDVQAGTYTNDFLSITHDLNLVAVGGTVTMVETEQPPNGKAMIDEGGSGVSVSISGFDISGVSVPDGNGAAIRYEGGTLTLDNVDFHDNQEGLLGAADENGAITITNSTFANNGTGDGATHNIYVGDINSLTITGSDITSADVGHDIKSRAENNTITGNTITDGSTGTASYEIDLPNGGNATISDNTIQKGAGAQNPIAISFGEEGSVYASSSLTVSGNTIVSEDTSASTIAIKNTTSVTADVSDNVFYGWTTLTSGLATLSGNTVASTKPSITGSTGSTSTSTGSTSDDTSSTAAATGTTSSSGTSGSTDTSTTTASSDSSSSLASAFGHGFDHTSSPAWSWSGSADGRGSSIGGEHPETGGNAGSIWSMSHEARPGVLPAQS